MKADIFYSYFRAVKKIKKQGGKLEKDGWVVNNNLSLSYLDLYFLPIIKNVVGDFHCYNNKLTTLKGSPRKVCGSFDCSNNKLKTLKGAPLEVGYDFVYYGNKVKDDMEVNRTRVSGYVCSREGVFNPALD